MFGRSTCGKKPRDCPVNLNVSPKGVTVLLRVYGLRPTVSLMRRRKIIFCEKWPFFRVVYALADVASSLQV